MKTKWIKYLRNLYYSFPIQLLILHINKHPFFLLFWVFLFMVVLQLFGVSYGVPLLLLDPEYLGEVNFISFLIVGFAMGDSSWRGIYLIIFSIVTDFNF